MNNYQPRAPHPGRTAVEPCHTTVHATSCNTQLTPGEDPGRAKHLDGSPYPEGVVFFEGEVAAPAGGQLIDPAVASRRARVRASIRALRASTALRRWISSAPIGHGATQRAHRAGSSPAEQARSR